MKSTSNKKSSNKIKSGQGKNSKSIRSYNEKTVLHILRYLKTASRNDLSDYTNLTSQSLAMITNSLEKKRLIVNAGKLINGIGQPSILYRLNPEGVYSVGFNIGRKSLDTLLVNFAGEICLQDFFEYNYPEMGAVVKKIKEFVNKCYKEFPKMEKIAFAGVGVGMPNFLGSWEREFDDNSKIKNWNQEKFQKRVVEELRCPVYFEKDMNAAAMAAMIKGNGSRLKNFIYIYLGTFVGGGIVMDRKIVKGEVNNCGNFGTLLVNVPSSSAIYDPIHPQPCQLLSYVSINHLKKFLTRQGIKIPQLNKDFFPLLEAPSPLMEKWLEVWLEEVAKLLAHAILLINSVLDLPNVIIDSSLNDRIVKQLVRLVGQNIPQLDTTGLIVPKVIQGDLGANARALGSAMIPIYEQYVPNDSVISKSVELNLIPVNT